MIDFFELVIPRVSIFMFALFGFALLFSCLSLFMLFSGRRWKFGLLNIVLGGSVFLLFLSVLAVDAADWVLQRHVVRMAGNASLYIDGRKVVAPEDQCLRKSLSEIPGTYKVSGSRPTQSHSLVVEGEDERLRFIARRDSREPSLYWLYYPNYKNAASVGWLRLGGCDLLMDKYLGGVNGCDERDDANGQCLGPG